MRKIYARRWLNKVFHNLPLQYFLLGLLSCMFMWFRTESAYETELFKNINEKILHSLPPHPSRDTFALAALHMTHFLQERRNLVFGEMPFNSLKFRYIHPATVDLMTGNGACGSYSQVLARILKSYDMKVRFGQMMVHGQPAGHIFVETLTESGWIVLDPLYNTAYTRPDGRFATYEDIHANWEYYKSQTPKDYDTSYRFEGVQYTNWNKLSFISQGVKKLLNLVLGKSTADKISIRPYLLRIYDKMAWIVFVLLLLLAARTLWLYRKTRMSA